MAEVAAPAHHGRHTGSVNSMASISGGPHIEMVANPDFSFPMVPSSAPLAKPRDTTAESSKRPASMHISPPPPHSAASSHRRAASTLPSFTFNAVDTSGLAQESSPRTSEDNAPTTPSRRGHRRGGSEFVGGDSRLGVSNALSSSPTKSHALPVPLPITSAPPPGRRGHAHRRSAAISSHDVGSIMQPADAQQRLSSSLPSTPLSHPADAPPPLDRTSSAPEVNTGLPDPFGTTAEEAPTRPPSRPRVGFSDNVEYIPRPLSTISSETESSMSTMRGHSVNNSISSVLSLSSPSPPSTRTPRTLSSTPEDEVKPKARSSLEISKRVEKEGEWLKSRSSNSLRRPLSEPGVQSPKTTFAVPEPAARRRPSHKKKSSLGHALGFDRRRSEPSIGISAGESTRLSTISLQESTSGLADGTNLQGVEHVSSAKKLKAWAASKMHRRSKEHTKSVTASSSTSSMRPESAGNAFVPGKIPLAEPPVAETNLDTVFSSQATTADPAPPRTPPQARGEMDTPASSHSSHFNTQDSDDFGGMLDLDAALGPFKTPPIGSHRQRRELHSSRLTKDFTGPGGHYHRRAESAPALAPFEYNRNSSQPQAGMADVFEEDEEEDASASESLGHDASGQDEETSVGIQVVDSDGDPRGNNNTTLNWGLDTGLGIQRTEWEAERPSLPHSNPSLRLSTPSTDRRGSSIAEETIMEEVSPAEVEIVEAHEEPRASSLTKSSDSSETPTVVAPPTGMLSLPDTQQPLMTPDTYQTSTFSSPDFGRWQGSFDTSRLGTSASSITDNRTMSSCTTGEPSHEVRKSVDDVPSLTSSRSTMLSTIHANSSRRDFGAAGDRTPSAGSAPLNPAVAAERRRKRNSIQSLSQLVGGPFAAKSRSPADESRPQTAAASISSKTPKKKEHRMKKLMFWKSKQSSKQAAPATLQ